MAEKTESEDTRAKPQEDDIQKLSEDRPGRRSGDQHEEQQEQHGEPQISPDMPPTEHSADTKGYPPPKRGAFRSSRSLSPRFPPSIHPRFRYLLCVPTKENGPEYFVFDVESQSQRMLAAAFEQSDFSDHNVWRVVFDRVHVDERKRTKIVVHRKTGEVKEFWWQKVKYSALPNTESESGESGASEVDEEVQDSNSEEVAETEVGEGERDE